MVEFTDITKERLQEIVAWAKPYGPDARESCNVHEICDMASELLALLASVKTVPEALEQLRAAIKAADADKSRRNELLATLLVNIEKNEPTAEFAVALRDFVREERPKLSTIEASAAEGEVAFDEAASAAWEFVRAGILERGREKGYAGVWGDGFRQGWDAASRARRRPSPAAASEVTDDMVERAARAFDAFAFQSWQNSYDYKMRLSGDADEAKAFADWCMGKRIEEARTNARAAFVAALQPNGVM